MLFYLQVAFLPGLCEEIVRAVFELARRARVFVS